MNKNGFSGSSLQGHRLPVPRWKDASRLVAALLFMVALTACSKSHVTPQPGTEHQLMISFTGATIPISLVDSGIVIFKKQGSGTQYLKHFEKSQSSMQVIIDDLPNGEWTADMYIDGRSGTDTSKRQYKRAASFTKDYHSGDVTLKAPVGTITDNWKPSVILTDHLREVQVIVPLDNTDPYFEIRMQDKSWNHFLVERYANNRKEIGNEIMASAKWECTGNCFTHDNWILNKEAFGPFAEKVKTKTWNNGEIVVEITGNVPGKALSFLYIYTL